MFEHVPDAAERTDWGALLFRAFIALLGVLVAALCIRVLWQFRDVFTPIGLLVGGAWVFQRTVLRRQS